MKGIYLGSAFFVYLINKANIYVLNIKLFYMGQLKYLKTIIFINNCPFWGN